MRLKLKSRILKMLFSAGGILLLTGCMQEMAQRDYASSEEGYETKVTQNAVEQVRQGDRVLAPLVVNNPYALANSLGVQQNAVGGANRYIPVINNNAAFSDLNSGIIQPGVFMQNTSPTYVPPSTFGSSIYSPASR